MSNRWFRYALVGLVVSAGCSDRADCSPGAEACRCYGNGTCNVGLACLSQVCVDADGDASVAEGQSDDFTPVGERAPSSDGAAAGEGDRPGTPNQAEDDASSDDSGEVTRDDETLDEDPSLADDLEPGGPVSPDGTDGTDDATDDAVGAIVDEGSDSGNDAGSAPSDTPSGVPPLLPQCASNDDCANTQLCNQGACEAAPCSSGADCATGICAASSVCIECATNLDCEGNQICELNTCRTQCADDSDCAANGQLCDKDANLCVDCFAHADCAEASFCSGKHCVPDECVEGPWFCQRGLLWTCSEFGTYGELLSCPSGQACADTGMGPACIEYACSPGSRFCRGETEIVSCDIDGQTEQLVSDCAEQEQVCIDAYCRDGCTPGETKCSNGHVVSCTTSRDFNTSQYCSAGRVCEDESFTCVPRTCVAGPDCDGNVARTCAESGSEFIDTGIDCGVQQCAAGRCVDALFFDDFENGLDQWSNTSPPNHGFNLFSSTPSDSGSSVAIAQSVNSTEEFDGPYVDLEQLEKPALIRFWARGPTGIGSAELAFSSSSEPSGDVFSFFFGPDDSLRVSTWADDRPVSWQMYSDQDTWYLVELKYIDWETRSFDLYVDGELKVVDLRFGSSAGIRRIDLHSGGLGGILALDDIGLY